MCTNTERQKLVAIILAPSGARGTHTSENIWLWIHELILELYIVWLEIIIIINGNNSNALFSSARHIHFAVNIASRFFCLID